MSDFAKTNWARPEFSRGYRDNADVFILDRRRMLDILQSFYAHFVKNGTRIKMLDLGCGDGIITEVVARIDPSISATLVDGSADMLGKARERLRGLRRTRYIHSSFQEMIRSNSVRGRFNFVASSLAIHHLTLEEKKALYEKISGLLERGGYFVNVDVVLAPSERLERWYLSLWKDWIDEKKWGLGMAGEGLEGIIERYKNEEENKPDTLQAQLKALRDSGLEDVDCYYQHGIFTVFGGRK
jgi:tRNA (cmo5U34)-methyltransferase